MNKFLKFVGLILVFVIASLFILDALYTKVFENSVSRNKTQYILGLEDNAKIDYVFLGNSRVQYSIVTKEIEKLKNKKVLNLGTLGAGLDDINLFLKLLIDKNIEIGRLFIQVDYTYNYESSSDLVRAQAVPYIRENAVINNYLKRVDSKYYLNYYVPFYRYAVNDYRLGFREFFSSAIGKRTKMDFSDGFTPIWGVLKGDDTYHLPKTILGKNDHIIKEIDSICKAKDINVTYFSAPFCANTNTNDFLFKLKQKLPNFKDFSTSIKENRFFRDCKHLNANGAAVFTDLLIDELGL